MPGRSKQSVPEEAHHHVPILSPPNFQEESIRRWYRVASDIGQLPGRYDERDEEEEVAHHGLEESRAAWGGQLEFLMSCIATSVGLGNVWRFPFVAFKNGGGAFLIPYIIVLILIGKPMYYLECALGQFSSRNCVRMWSLSPGMRGTGYAQAMCSGYILSYYVAIIALCMHYFVYSFTMPWAECKPEWVNCIPSRPVKGSIVNATSEPSDGDVANNGNVTVTTNATSSAEYYFIKTVLRQSDGIEDGLGVPLVDLTICLFAAWFSVFVIVARSIKSSGKASYFLAIFPYIVMIILLCTAVMLPGSLKGILFFITPKWAKLLELNVWYAAVTQVFFSLSVGTGAIVMFSSYNGFTQNVYRDANIVTTLDTLTSLLSGCTIFAILGNLAYELNQEMEDVIGSGGTGLAFVSYPDAISKTQYAKVLSVLFFVMMIVLGIGSAVALLSTINSVLVDGFPKVKDIYFSIFTCSFGFLIGLVYMTPGGQYILELVDYYGGTFLVLFAAITEVIGVFWIYGLENLCLDIEFMLGKPTSMYWRFCWGLITPFIMIVVFVYALFTTKALVFAGRYYYPTLAYVCGYMMLLVGVITVFLYIFISLYRNRTGVFKETLKKTFYHKESWGPRTALDRMNWKKFKSLAKTENKKIKKSQCHHLWMSLTAGYDRRLLELIKNAQK